MLQLNLYKGRRRPLEFLVPECWDEMSAHQVTRVAEILFTSAEPGNVSEIDHGRIAEIDHGTNRALRIARVLCGLNISDFVTIPSHVVAYEVLPLFTWVEESCNLTAQLLPSVKTNAGVLYGPIEKLGNLRFIEFDFAERAYHEWLQSPDDESKLLQFVATLYRPAKKDYDMEANPEGDVREEFNANLIPKYAKMLASAPYGFLRAVVLWYRGCREYITEAFPDVFRSPEGEQTAEADETPGYFGLMRSIAKAGTYGTFDDVAQLFLYNALMEMNAAEQERQTMEAAIEDAKRNNH